MSKNCKNPKCMKEIKAIRRSGYCEKCYTAYELGYQTGYNAKRKELVK